MAKDTEPQPLQPELEAALRQLQAGQPPLEDLLCGNSSHATRLRDLQQRADAAEAQVAELREQYESAHRFQRELQGECDSLRAEITRLHKCIEAQRYERDKTVKEVGEERDGAYAERNEARQCEELIRADRDGLHAELARVRPLLRRAQAYTTHGERCATWSGGNCTCQYPAFAHELDTELNTGPLPDVGAVSSPKAKENNPP